MIKAVIFDLDGTLVKFNLDVKACKSEIIKYLTEYGCPRSLFSVQETGFDMLIKAKKYLSKEKLKKHQSFKIKKGVFSIVKSFELRAAMTTEIFPNVPNTLKTLKEMKLKIGLCTINSEKATRFILNRFNLTKFFDTVLTREKVSEVKPNPAHLKGILSALNVSPEEAIMVGDSVRDVTCANHLNVLAIGVMTGISSMEDLIRSGVHYVLSSVNDLPKLLLELEKQT